MRHTRKGKILIAVLLLLSMVIGLAACGEENTAPVEPPKEVVIDTATIFNMTSYGMVAAADDVSYGLATTGLLSYVGFTNGKRACFDWTDIVYIAVSTKLTAAVDKYGNVLVAGSEDLSEKTESWKNVTMVCCTNDAVYGLQKDGTVVSTNGDLADSSNIVWIDATNDYCVAVSSDGGVFTSGKAPEISGIEEPMVQVSAGARHIAGINPYGELVSSRSSDPFAGRQNCVAAFAGDGYTAYIDTEGTLHTDYTAMSAETKDVAWFSCSSDHALVLYKNGTVESFGDNDYLQGSVENWRLRPYTVSGGYVLGIAPGSTDKSGATIKTGSKVELEGGVSGTAVILGDVDQDGKISSADLEKIGNHINGKETLEDAQLQAADIIRDGSVDAADSEQLRYHLLGYTVIDQYAKEFVYKSEIADSERSNTDTVGYIKLDNTNIDAPIMYGDNWFYHYHNPSKASSSWGSLYLYYGYPSHNTVITGHNIRTPGAVLHDLHTIQDEYAKDYDQPANRMWHVNLYGETGLYEVFAMYEEKAKSVEKSSWYYNCNFNYTMEGMSDAEIDTWIQYQLDRTELTYKVPVSREDRFLTVMTCADTHAEANNGSRIYYFLRRVDGH